MEKISSRDIQLVVAGAFALDGFRALIGVAYYLASPMDWRRIAGALFAGLALPIGIRLVLSKASAIPWARFYLWFALIWGCIGFSSAYFFSPERVGAVASRLVPEMLVAGVLLGLLSWSNSERFRHKPNA